MATIIVPHLEKKKPTLAALKTLNVGDIAILKGHTYSVAHRYVPLLIDVSRRRYRVISKPFDTWIKRTA